MPCPHNEITIVQRSQRQSAVAAAAYQSGEKLFCEYDQQVKHYPEKRGIVHNPMSFKVPDRLLTDGQCRMRINGVQFVQALLEANGLAAGKDYQFKGRYEAEKNAVIISLEKDEREC